MPPPITRMSTDCAVKPHPSPSRRTIKKRRRETVPGERKRPYSHAELVPQAIMADIAIINPRFDISFWGMERCIGLLGKRANLPVACLALLAALIPDRHDVTLIDENVEDIDFLRLARADLVCLTGVSIQGRSLREILERVS